MKLYFKHNYFHPNTLAGKQSNFVIINLSKTILNKISIVRSKSKSMSATNIFK